MTRPPNGPRRSQGNERGFTLLELLVSVFIMLVVTGAIFALVDPSRGTVRAQPEVSDMQQRMRVGIDMLSKDLMMAGAGVYMGTGSGALINFFAPVLPYCVGPGCPGDAEHAPCAGAAPHRFCSDQITITYVPNTPSQASVRDAMPDNSAEMKVNRQAHCGEENSPTVLCPDGSYSSGSLCGFCDYDRVLIFDDTGAFDFFSITKINADNTNNNPGPLIQHNEDKDLSKRYCAEAWPPQPNCEDPGHHPTITKVVSHTYFLNTQLNQLFYYSGGLDANGVPAPAVPIVDNVVALQFQYFGDTARPTTVGCEAVETMAMPPSTGSSLVGLEPWLTDGPTCPTAAHPSRSNKPDNLNNLFDAHLYLVRKVRVTLRIQAPFEDLRGPDRFLFRNPARSQSGTRFVPDYELSFEITPRNMNLGR